MQIHLHCPNCPCRFSAPADLPTEEVLERMTEDAPWFAPGRGGNFEGMVRAALSSRGKILCPGCRGKMLVASAAGTGQQFPSACRISPADRAQQGSHRE